MRELLREPGPGRVLVVDGGGSMRCALLRDQLAGSVRANGCSGVIIIGCIRDSVTLAALPVGVMARGMQPRRSDQRGQGVQGVAIEPLGARVSPGDFVYADEDGVVFSPQALHE